MSTTETKKSLKKSSKAKKLDESVVEQPEVIAPVPVEKEKKVKTKKVKDLPQEEPVKVEPSEQVELNQQESSEQPNESQDSTEKDKLSRKKKSYNQLVSEVDTLNSLVEKYITDHKDAKNPELSRFLKNLDKGLKKVKVHVNKFGKNKSSSSGASSNIQSGFQKPVRLSQQIADFTGWDVSEPHARVEVTNFVCNYIKQNNLQSPTDKRVIIADQKLSNLLEYDQSKDGDLTYASIQKLLAKHYTPIVPAVVS